METRGYQWRWPGDHHEELQWRCLFEEEIVSKGAYSRPPTGGVPESPYQLCDPPDKKKDTFAALCRDPLIQDSARDRQLISLQGDAGPDSYREGPAMTPYFYCLQNKIGHLRGPVPRSPNTRLSTRSQLVSLVIGIEFSFSIPLPVLIIEVNH